MNPSRNAPASPSPTRVGSRRETSNSRQPWLILAVILAAHFLIVSSIGSITVALPTLQQELDASPADLQWLLALYQLGYAVTLVTGGRLGDLFGSRRVMLAGLAAFVLAATLCCFSASIAILLIGRLVQGLAGGLTSPQVLAIIQDVFEPARRPRAFSLFGMVSGGGFIVGQILGGVVIDLDPFGLGWRAIFVVTVALGAVAFVGAVLVLPKSARRPADVDVAGIVLVSLVGLLILFPVIQGRQAGWPPSFLVLFALAVPTVVLLLRHERGRAQRGREVLLDLEMLRIRSFRSGLTLSTLFAFMAFAPVVLLTLTLQLGFGFSPTRAVLTTCVGPVATMLAASAAPSVLARIHNRIFVLSGIASLGASLTMIILIRQGPHPPGVLTLAPALVLVGISSGLFQPSVTRLTLSDVSATQVGGASGMFQSVQQIAAAFGVAAFSTVFFAVLGTSTTTNDHIQAMSTAMLVGVACSCLLIVVASRLTSSSRGEARIVA